MSNLTPLRCSPSAMPVPGEGEGLEHGGREGKVFWGRGWLTLYPFVLFFSRPCPLALSLLLCSLVFSALGWGAWWDPCALWAPQTLHPAAFPNNPGSWEHLVLLSPESLFNIISFLLTFIKTNIGQRTLYTPTRDTLHFDIKKTKQNQT